MHRITSGLASLGLSFASLSIGSQHAAAQTVVDNHWATAGNGDWSDPTRWSAGVVPNNGSPANTNYNVFLDAPGGMSNITYNQTAAINALTIANSTTLFDVQGGTLSIANGGTLQTGCNLVHENGTISLPNASTGLGLSGSAHYTMIAGTLSLSSSGGYVTVGGLSGDNASVTLFGNGFITANRLTAGLTNGTGNIYQDNGTVLLTGAQNSLSLGEADSSVAGVHDSQGGYRLGFGTLSTSNEYVGASTVGTFTQNGGLNLIPVGTTNSLVIGDDAGSVGTYQLNGGTLQSSATVIGHFGAGTMTQIGGLHAVSGVLRIARDAGSTGYYALGGGSLTTGGEADVGYGGAGTLVLFTGGKHIAAAPLYVGKNANSTGLYQINGGTLTATSVSIGLAGTGTFQQSGGLASVSGAMTNSATGSIALSGGSFTAGSTANNGTVTISGTATSTLGAVTGSGSIAISGGGQVGVASLRQSRLSTQGNGSLTVAANGTAAAVSQLTTLSIADAATFDLTDNDLIVGSGTPRAQVVSYVKNARNNGQWNQPGLTASAAKPVVGGPTVAPTGLVVISAAQYTSVNPAANTSFDGVSLAGTETLVKYSWNGDVTLDGKIDANDYSRIDGGFVASQSNPNLVKEYFNGDFNFDGAIDANDYSLIDGAFTTQNGVLLRAVTYLTGGPVDPGDLGSIQTVIDHAQQFGDIYVNSFLATNAPEPTLVGLVGLLGLGVQRRRNNPRTANNTAA